MNKFLILLLLPLLSFCQWSYDENKDPFDGNTKTVYAYGSKGNYPYRTPLLVFRIRENKRDIYITDAGSTACDNPYIDVSFGDPKSIISFNLIKGISGDSGFIDMFETKKIFELIKNLKRFNKAYIKFGTDCSVNNFEISLKGSSTNLSKIFSDVDFSSFNPNIDLGKFYSEKNKSKISQSISFADSFFKKNRLAFSPFDLRTIHREIEDGVLSRDLILTEIEVLKHEFLKTAITLKLGFENTHFKETHRIYIKNTSEKENSIEEKSRIDSLLSKYKNNDLIKYLKKKVVAYEYFYKYDEKNISKIEITINRIEFDKLWNGYLVIFLNNKKTTRIELKTISLEDINKNTLNEDFKLNVPF